MWYKGYIHYHTSFHYPLKFRITPEKLINGIKEMGASFVFCSGGHGDDRGGRGDYFGWGEEYTTYQKICHSYSDPSFIFIPALELSINFHPMKISQHHTCVPGLKSLSSTPSLRTNPYYIPGQQIDCFISEIHRQKLTAVLNHPYLSTIDPNINGPSPFNIIPFYKFDYLELSAADHLDYFPRDFDIYRKFFQNSTSIRMGCCSAVDNAHTAYLPPSLEPRTLNSTYLYIRGKFNYENLMRAWKERRTYAVRGNLRLKKIAPIPGKEYIKTSKSPKIKLEIENLGNKTIKRIEIYRNGKKVYQKTVNQKTYSFFWQDEKLLERSSYILHVKAETDHLVTSPINFEAMDD